MFAHLYIHVPFCLRRCSYCDFAVTATREPPIDAWLGALEAELRLRLGEGSPRRKLQTVYLGGGTPSLLGTGGMEALVDRLNRHFEWDPTVEWTVEANPESFTAPLAEEWLAAGVNRLSFGAQSFDPEVLRWMGRLHGPDGPAHAVAAARSAGFGNIGLDLIFGLPTRLRRDWDADLDRALDLSPDHVALYGLTAEPATPLGRWVRDGRETLPPDDTYEAEYLRAAERLTAAGFEHYEVSNFARPGRVSRHNGAYWTGAPYLGLGPGAHSFDPPHRWWNVRDWDEYRRRTLAGQLPTEGEEQVNEQLRALERTWLGLRTTAGLSNLSTRQATAVRSWAEAGWAELADDVVRLTPKGWLLLDRLAVELDALA